MTDLDKDYKFYKAKEWFDRPAYYVERGEVVDKRGIKADFLHKQRNTNVAERT